MWQDIVVKGCYFHYRQAVSRWIFGNGFKKSYYANDAFKTWCRKIGCLALIPLEHVETGWQQLNANPPVDVDVRAIFKYFESTWLRRFQPAMWNHHDGPRSNNHLESYNAYIKRQIKQGHPDIWSAVLAARFLVDIALYMDQFTAATHVIGQLSLSTLTSAGSSTLTHLAQHSRPSMMHSPTGSITWPNVQT